MGKDIEEKFGEIMVGLASEDPDLTDYYQQRIYGEDYGLGDNDRQFIEGMIRWHYPMTSHQTSRAVGQCVAQLIDGVELGKDLFKDVK